MTQNKFAIQKVLRDKLANIDMSDKEGYIVLSITDDASIYVNKNDGTQLKLTDLIVLTSPEQLEEVDIPENKLVIVNPEEDDAKLSAHIKIDGELVDIFADVNTEITAVATNLENLKTSLEEIDTKVQKIDARVTANTNHLIISIDELNRIKKKEAVKNYKAIIPLSNVRAGVVDPILPVSSFMFSAGQKVSIKSLSALAIGNFDNEVDAKLELEIKYATNSEEHEVILITIDKDHKTIDQEVALIQEFTEGYYFINVKEVTGAKNVKVTLTLMVERKEQYEELDKPTGDIPQI